MNRWALTAESKDLFDALYRGTIRGRRARVAALRRIGEFGQPAAIPRLAGFLDPSKRHEATAALEAIGRLLQSAQPSELRRLDLEIRRQAPYWGFGTLGPKDVARLRALSGETLATAAICSMHRSGYVREAAVRELALRADRLELPFLMLRAADWVPEVREVAQAAVLARLTPSYLPALVSCLTLVEGESYATGRASSLAPGIDALLSDSGSAEILLQGLSVSDRPSRRAVARRLARLQTVQPAAFFEAASRQDDVVVVTIAGESAVRALEDDDLGAVLQRLRTHPIGRLRQLALWTTVSRFPAAAEEALHEALFDRQGGVRDIAQRQLASRNADVAGIYRDALLRGPGVAIALLGLAEVGTKDDASLAAAHLTADAVSIRRAATRAVARLDPAGQRDALLERLADLSSSVSREALKGLEQSAGAVADRVWAICIGTPEAHVRANCFRLLGSLGKWDVLRWGLTAALRPEPDVAGGGRFLVDRSLARWNASFTTPSPRQLEEIAALMSRADAVMDRRTHDHLQFALRAYISPEG